MLFRKTHLNRLPAVYTPCLNKRATLLWRQLLSNLGFAKFFYCY